MTTFLSALQGTFPCSSCQCEPHGTVEVEALYLNLRVESLACDRAVGHADVQVAAGAGELGNHPPRDLELHRQVAGCRRAVARARCGGRASAHRVRDGGRNSEWERLPRRAARPHRSRGAAFPPTASPSSDLDVMLEPDSRKPGARATVELGDDPPTVGDEPRRGSLSEHRHRDLRDDRDPQRVRERSVERRGGHHRHALGAMLELGEVEAEQAFAERRRQLLPHLGRDRGRSALDGHGLDREGRGSTRGGVETERGQEDQQPDQKGAARRSDLGQLEAAARPSAWKGDGSRGTRSRAWAIP